jgi:predicted dehydrogenase
MIAESRPDAVVVATPATTHLAVASLALSAGADVLVEKPLATTSAAGRALVSLAARHRRLLMVGHIFHYHAAMTRLHSLVRSGSLGQVRYLYSTRTNLGPIRNDVNVLWDLAPHDVAMQLMLTDDIPTEVSATGQSYLRGRLADVAFGTLFFRRKKVIGHLQVSWLDPHKVRKLTVIGSRRMAVFDDVETQAPLRLFDRGVMRDKVFDDFGQFHLMLRDGDINIPHVPTEEPLRAEAAHFIECVQRRRRPLTDGRFGLTVVRVLEALDASLKAKGRPIRVRA